MKKTTKIKKNNLLEVHASRYFCSIEWKNVTFKPLLLPEKVFTDIKKINNKYPSLFRQYKFFAFLRSRLKKY